MSVDVYAGTVYRDLVNAEDAVEMARYLGVDGGVGFDPVEAVEKIDAAITALQAARSKLSFR